MPSSKKPTWRRVVTYGVVAAFLVVADPRSPLLEIGLGLAALGLLVRFWATGHLVKNDSLTRSGPYAHVRNPLYLGTLLILVGFAIAGSSTELPGAIVPFVLLPFGLAVFLAYYLPRKLRIEGERLERRFGPEATAYSAAVPALWPRLKPVHVGPPEPFVFARVLTNNEHLTVVAVALGAAALVVKRAALGS